MSNQEQIEQSGAIAGSGQRLRQARELAGLSVQDVASKLKMPARTIEALEREDYSQLGAPVFVRGQLRSYGRLLGLPPDILIETAGIAPVTPVELTPRTYTPKMQVIGEQLARRAVYIVLTIALVVPVWLAMNAQGNLGGKSTSLDVAVEPSPAPNAAAQPTQNAPLKASMAPTPAARPAAPALRIRAQDDAWINVTAPDGSTIDSLLLKAGEQRDYRAGQVGNMVLGNATSVVVEHNGQPVDTTQWQRGNVARFKVSSDAFPVPIEAAQSSQD